MCIYMYTYIHIHTYIIYIYRYIHIKYICICTYTNIHNIAKVARESAGVLMRVTVNPVLEDVEGDVAYPAALAANCTDIDSPPDDAAVVLMADLKALCPEELGGEAEEGGAGELGGGREWVGAAVFVWVWCGLNLVARRRH